MRWLLGLALLAFAFRLLKADQATLGRLWSTPPRALIGLSVLSGVNQFLMSWRLSLAVAECGGGGVSAGAWFRLTSVGQFLNLFVPQLGNVYRGVVLKRDYGIPYLSYASGLVAFVWLDMLLGFLVALLVILAHDPHLLLVGVPAPLLIVLVLSGLLLGPVVLARGLGAFRLGEGFAGRAQRRASTLLETTGRSLKNPRFLLRFFGVNLLGTAGQVLGLWLAFDAVGAFVPLGVLIVFQVFIKLSNQVMVTPGNLGLTELAYGVLASSTCSLQQGIAASLLNRAVSMATIILLGLLTGGGPLLFRGKRGVEET